MRTRIVCAVYMLAVACAYAEENVPPVYGAKTNGPVDVRRPRETLVTLHITVRMSTKQCDGTPHTHTLEYSAEPTRPHLFDASLENIVLMPGDPFVQELYRKAGVVDSIIKLEKPGEITVHVPALKRPEIGNITYYLSNLDGAVASVNVPFCVEEIEHR